MTNANRPYKLGQFDRQEYIVANNEQQFRAINTVDGYPVIIAMAKQSADQSQSVWQLRQITYDSSYATIAVRWPVDANGTPSTDYKFKFGPDQFSSITAISQSSPCHVTANNSFANGQFVLLRDVLGMSQVNFAGSNLYKVANVSPTGFDLLGVDSSGFSAYSGGGAVQSNSALQYTFL